MRQALMLWLALSMCGCDQPSPSGQTPTDTVVEPPPSEGAAEPSTATLPAVIAEDAVRPLLDEWLRAQNDGDFAAYSALYAARFEGIKRAGPRMSRFDHDAWLKDREPLFKKTMTVAADDVSITTTPNAALIEFEQTWSSGSSSVTGPKQLVVTPSDTGFTISKEEMLSRAVSDEADPGYDPQTFALVVAGRVVLDLAPDAEWATGPPRLEVRPNPSQTVATAVRSVDVDATGFGGWVGREFHFFDGAHAVCTAKIARIELVARAVPPYDTVLAWEGAATDPAVADSVWRLARAGALGESVQLVGAIEPNDACAGAIWAKPRGSTAKPLPARNLGGPKQRELVGSYTDLPPYHARQADYDASGRKGPWHADDAAASRFVRFGGWAVGSAALSFGCGGFEAALTSIWRAALGGFVAEAEDVGVWWMFEPTAALKVGDRVYFIGADEVVGKGKDGWRSMWQTRPVVWDSGC